MPIAKLCAIILSFSFAIAQDLDSIGPDLGIYTGFLDIKADSMGVPLFLDGIFIGETPLVNPIPVYPVFTRLVICRLKRQNGSGTMSCFPML